MFVCTKEKEILKSLRGIRQAKVKYSVNKVNCVLKKSNIRKLTGRNNTAHAAAALTSELVGATNLAKSKKRSLGERDS